MKRRKAKAVRKLPLLSRKNLLLLALSGLFAAFVMLLGYVHWLPEQEVSITIQATGNRDERSESSEVRIFYVEVDGRLLALDAFMQDGWEFQGSLVTWGAGRTSITLPARRFVEVSLMRGPAAGIAYVTVNGETSQRNLYHASANQQEVINFRANGYFSALNVLIGLLSLAAFYLSLRHALRGKMLSEPWGAKPDLPDVAVYVGIPVASVMAMLTTDIAPYVRGWQLNFDVSVFTANGNLVNQRLIPYLEIWDHKGVMIFWFNAIGHWLWYPFGAWILETALVTVGFIFCFKTLSMKFAKSISIYATFLTIGAYGVLQAGGGSVSSWSMPFVFASSYIFVYTFKHDFRIAKKWIAICGAMCAIVFLFRANNPILWAAAVPVLVIAQLREKNYRELMQQSGFFLLGFLGIILPVYLYLVASNAVAEMIDATKVFNTHYSRVANTGLEAWYQAMLGLFDRFRENFPLLTHVLAAGLIYPAAKIAHTYKSQEKSQEATHSAFDICFYAMYLMGFVCFILFGNLSARLFMHYMILLVPIFAGIVAYALQFANDVFLSVNDNFAKKYPAIFHSLLLLVLFYLIFPLYSVPVGNRPPVPVAAARSLQAARIASAANLEYRAVASYIMANTDEFDRIGQWGPSTVALLNMMPNKLPATRFHYPESWVQFRQDIEEMDYSDVFMEDLLGSNPRFFARQANQVPMAVLQAHLDMYYVPVEFFEANSHVVLYERRN